jgi:hypothetical protein
MKVSVEVEIDSDGKAWAIGDGWKQKLIEPEADFLRACGTPVMKLYQIPVPDSPYGPVFTCQHVLDRQAKIDLGDFRLFQEEEGPIVTAPCPRCVGELDPNGQFELMWVADERAKDGDLIWTDKAPCKAVAVATIN